MENPFCPNCGKAAEKNGNKIICAECDAEFLITQDKTARVEKTGVITDLQNRVSALEGNKPAEPEPAADPDDQGPAGDPNDQGPAGDPDDQEPAGDPDDQEPAADPDGEEDLW